MNAEFHWMKKLNYHFFPFPFFFPPPTEIVNSAPTYSYIYSVSPFFGSSGFSSAGFFSCSFDFWPAAAWKKPCYKTNKIIVYSGSHLLLLPFSQQAFSYHLHMNHIWWTTQTLTLFIHLFQTCLLLYEEYWSGLQYSFFNSNCRLPATDACSLYISSTRSSWSSSFACSPQVLLAHPDQQVALAVQVIWGYAVSQLASSGMRTRKPRLEHIME